MFSSIRKSNYAQLDLGETKCGHGGQQRWVRPWKAGNCWDCWRARIGILGFIFAVIGAILLSISLFDPFRTDGDQRGMGIAGVVLTGLAILSSIITGHRS